MKLRPSLVRKYTRFPKGGSVLGGLDVKEATLDIENGTWFVMFDGKVSRRQAREAMAHFVNRATNIPTNTRSFSSPKVVPVILKCDEVTTVRSNPSGRVTIAKGHLSFDGVMKNPTSATKFKQEMNDMVTHSPHKVFREFDYKKLNDAAFLDQLWSFVSYSGESYGWVTNKGKVFHRRASLIMPKIKINKRPDNEVAFYHTHPSKDEPSLTSADDIQFYADLAFAPGVKHNYTVMRDRIDYFQFDVKKRKVDEYLKIDEEHFVQDVDAMIEAGEAKYKDDKDLDEVEFCRLTTQHMVDAFNEKYKGLMKITYKHFVNPKYKGDEDPFPNPLPNPTSPTIPSKLQHHSLNDLQGVDYSWVHYGGDEFAHTLYTYYWMSHYFGPDSNGRSRLYKLENVGFNSDLRKKTRAYLSQRITANWTFLDLLYAVGLYHDIGKVREKETDDHHSIAGKYMWDEFIADALDVPHTFEDIVSTMLESDIGRRNISDDFFQTQVGEYYGVALIMQMADIATHHPHMFTSYAATARKAGLFKGNVRDYKMWAQREKVKKLEKFLEKPLKNPRPAATQITWRGDYGIESVNTSLAFSVLDDFKKSGRDEVWSLGQGASTFYMGFTGENVSRLKGLIPEGEEVSVNFWPNSTKIAIFFTKVHQQEDFGAKAAQIIYEEVGEILQGIEPRVKVDKVENAILVNPRKAKQTKVILVSGPPGTGKSTFIRFLKKKFPGVGEPLTVTTRPRRPKEKDGVDRIFTTKAEFRQMIEQDQFVEWAQQKNGHYYGRRWVDFKFPVNVVDLNLRGIRSYKEAFPQAYTVFLAPDIPPKSMVKRIMRRGGVTLGEAKRRAALGPTMVKQAKTMNFDQFVKVKSGSYDEVFAGIVKRMGDVLTNPRVHESQVMITIGPQITQQQTFDGQVLPFNERDRQYIRERERSIDFNRTAVGGDYVSFTIPAYFTDEQLPTGTVRSPVNRQNVLVPSADAPAFELFLSKGELPMGNAPLYERSMRGVPGRLYHGTSARAVDAIFASGQLNTSNNAFMGEGVYLTPSAKLAKAYAQRAAGLREEDARILEINIEGLERDNRHLVMRYAKAKYTSVLDEPADIYTVDTPIPIAYIRQVWTPGGALPSPPPVAKDNPKELFDWFEEWVHLINMKNKELKAFLDSPLGKKAGLSKKEADEQGIKSGRVSGRRILKMRAKLGLTGPKDYIKIGPRIIEDYYEKALDNWSGPSDDPLKGETDWDWCKRQVRFVKRHGAFPYNDNQKGPLVREQKTQNQVSRRLLGLWVWGHDPWRWARKHDVHKMPPCPDVPWIGMTEKRKYGKVEVKQNPPSTNLEWIYTPKDPNGIGANMHILQGYDRAKPFYSEPVTGWPTIQTYTGYNDLIPNVEVKWDVWTRLPDRNRFRTHWFDSHGISSLAWNIHADSAGAMWPKTDDSGKGHGQAAYLKILDYVDAVYSRAKHSKSAERVWEALEKRQTELGITIERMPDVWGEEGPYPARLMKRLKQNPPRPIPEFGYHFTHRNNLNSIMQKGLTADFNFLFYPDAPYQAWVLGGQIDGMFFGTGKRTGMPTQEQQMDALANMVMLKVRVDPQQYRPVPYEMGHLHDEFIVEGNILPWNIEYLGTFEDTIGEDLRSGRFTMDDVYAWADNMGYDPIPDPLKIIEGTFQTVRGTNPVKWFDEWKQSEHPKVRARLDETKQNPWFPSDTSYPSALTDQTISITQLSNPRTPGGKKVPTRYLKGLTKLERMIAEDEIDKGYEYDVDDPKAYEFWKSDIKAKARGLKIGSSKHKEEYYRRYRQNLDPDYKPSGKTPKQKFLNRIRKETGIKKSILEKTYDKGLAAWRTGHRPGVQQHQWAAGRVYALAVGADSSTGPGKPDHSLAVEAGVR